MNIDNVSRNTRRSTIAAKQTRLRILSKLFITTGVLVWVPFIGVTLLGKSVSILPYLAVHLPFILTGVWLKRRVAGQRPASKPTQALRLSNLLFLIGIGVWLPYFLFKYPLRQHLAIQPFLFVHLSGLFGGIFVRLNLVGRLLARRTPPHTQGDKSGEYGSSVEIDG